MDIVFRVLIGLLLFGLLGWISTLLYGLTTAVVVAPGMFMARFLRWVFRVKRGWGTGTAIGALFLSLGKTTSGSMFYLGTFWYFVVAPYGPPIEEWAILVSFLALVFAWMPGAFFAFLFADTTEHALSTFSQIEGTPRRGWE